MSEESQAISHNISLLLTNGKTAEARAELERLLSLDADDPDARSLAGDVYAYTGAHSAAYKQYNLAAETFNRLGRADMALAVHHKILELDPSMLDAATQTRIRLLHLLVSAEDAIVSGNHEKAVNGYREAIRQFPNHTITYQRLASLLVRLNRVEEAAEQYLVVARAFYAHGVLAKARPYFERVLELHPSQSEGLESVLACLKAEGKEDDGEKYLKAAVQAHLQAGRMEEAAAIFERLPETGRDGPTPLGAGLLLQSGEVGQAERMAGQLDLGRPELQDFFKRLGRAALERGDSIAADAYFRWSQGDAQNDAPIVPLAAVVAAPPPQAPPLAPPLGFAPPPGLGLPPPPPPGLGVPPPPPPMAAADPVPVLAPPPIAAAPLALAPLPVAPAPLPTAPPAELPSAQAAAFAQSLADSSPPPMPEQEDQNILQTMGEMCLAEEMFEEAKQVFERLCKADPARTSYWDLLNRSRAGLGLSPVFAPSRPPQMPGHAAAPSPPLPPVPVASATQVAPPAAVVPPAPVAPPTPPMAIAPPAPLTPPVVLTPSLTVAPPVTPVAVPETVSPVAPSVRPPEPVAVPVNVSLVAPPMTPPIPAVPETVAPPAPFAAPVVSAPAIPIASPPPLPPLAAPVAAALPTLPGLDAPPPAAPAFAGMPELEPMAQRTHVPVERSYSDVPRAEVEWSDAPTTADDVAAASSSTPPHAQGAQVPTPAPPPPPPPPAVLAPPPALPRAPRSADVAVATRVPVAMGTPGGARIERTQFTVQLGELPPAMHSDVDDNEEIIE